MNAAEWLSKNGFSAKSYGNVFDGKFAIIKRLRDEGERKLSGHMRVGKLYMAWCNHVGVESLKIKDTEMIQLMTDWLGDEKEPFSSNEILHHKGKKKKKKAKKKRHPKPAKKKSFYMSWEWKKLRYKILQEYGPVCMLCGTTSLEEKICVDHIKPRSKYPDLALREDNLQVLCNSCNMGKSNDDETDHRP